MRQKSSRSFGLTVYYAYRAHTSCTTALATLCFEINNVGISLASQPPDVHRVTTVGRDTLLMQKFSWQGFFRKKYFGRGGAPGNGCGFRYIFIQHQQSHMGGGLPLLKPYKATMYSPQVIFLNPPSKMQAGPLQYSYT